MASAADPRQHRLQFRRCAPVATAAGPRGAGVRSRGESCIAGGIQIRRLLPRQRSARGRRCAAAPSSRVAARHQLFHVHSNRLSGRRPSAQGAGTAPCQLRAFRHVLPAPARRPDPASQRDDAAVRGHVEQASAVAQPRRRRVPAHDRSREKGAYRGYVRADRRRRLRGAGDIECACRVAGGAGLHDADLFRFLGLHRHGARRGTPVQHKNADQFQLAVPGDRHPRLLAPLAHHAVAVPARISLHPARRQSGQRCRDRSQHPRDVFFGRPLARRRLDLRHLGIAARTRDGCLPRMEQDREAVAAGSRLGAHLRVRDGHLGVLSRDIARCGTRDAPGDGGNERSALAACTRLAW